MTIVALQTLFWLSLSAIAFSYAAYPAVVWLAAKLLGDDPQPTELEHASLPTISLLIAAHNEEEVIASRLDNALAMAYPTEKINIVIASDGSSDKTCEIVRGYLDPRVRLLDYAERRGKAAVLNAAMSVIDSDIVLLSDANTFSAPDAAKQLARWFTDSAVGAVCGKLVLVDPSTGRNVDSLYWKYETFLKQCEARLGALLGANGAIYALRRNCYVPIPDNTIVDDFVIPLLGRLRHGYQIVYDPEAVAVEETPASIGSEFRRRARIGAGGFQSIGLLPGLLNPRLGWLWFSFVSHKLLRWCCPFFLLILLTCNLFLAGQPPYRQILAAQSAFYLLSVAGACLPIGGRLMRLVRVSTMFTSMNLALLVGFGRWLSGQQRGVWQRTAR
jgi:cellulose synthase/poly-beta-1,6-N-acetylglucosamine synthase-like glycosyltransferase